MTREEAARIYVRALVARRDAQRLLDMGLSAAIEEPLKLLRPETLKVAILAVIAKEAADLVSLYDQDPEGHPEGRTAETALAVAVKTVRERYKGGKCRCGGPALRCARRHVQGRSCA